MMTRRTRVRNRRRAGKTVARPGGFTTSGQSQAELAQEDFLGVIQEITDAHGAYLSSELREAAREGNLKNAILAAREFVANMRQIRLPEEEARVVRVVEKWLEDCSLCLDFPEDS